jgi:prepilin-type N-terminal cleavage/methylation domain-containing protein/prepilin-type processing-associated H-X9-DG protein
MRPRAFTLVELLVVLGIIALLLAILLPSLAGARRSGRAAVCLSNLRQMAVAANLYAIDHAGTLPLAYDLPARIAWDFRRDSGEIRPGLLWLGMAPGAVQQCPSFDGRTDDPDEPFTGYNYNTSHLGGFRDLSAPAHVDSAKLAQIRRPSATALFGDGQWAGGANKFMRSPLPSDRDRFSLPLNNRFAGTQGFRHDNRTNTAHPDGHAAPQPDRHLGHPSFTNSVATDTGYLADDNTPYDLD